MKQIFLTYASREKSSAHDITMALRGRGFFVFLDEDNLPPAGDYHQRIQMAVAQSDAVVFLITPESVASGSYTLTELKYAQKKWKHPRQRVLPVLLTPTESKQIPSYLKAVTVLEPLGNVAAEIAEAVEDMLKDSQPMSSGQVKIGISAIKPVDGPYNGDKRRFNFEDISDVTDPRHGNKLTYIGNFTKCLPHDADGFLIDPADYDNWVRAIDSGDPRDFRRLRICPDPFAADGDFQYTSPLDPNSPPMRNWAHTYPAGEEPRVRAWESQGAGFTYDLEEPDAQAATMPPCPSLDSQELIAEMAEVYWMAVCRDIAFDYCQIIPLEGQFFISIKLINGSIC